MRKALDLVVDHAPWYSVRCDRTDATSGKSVVAREQFTARIARGHRCIRTGIKYHSYISYSYPSKSRPHRETFIPSHQSRCAIQNDRFEYCKLFRTCQNSHSTHPVKPAEAKDTRKGRDHHHLAPRKVQDTRLHSWAPGMSFISQVGVLWLW